MRRLVLLLAATALLASCGRVDVRDAAAVSASVREEVDASGLRTVSGPLVIDYAIGGDWIIKAVFERGRERPIFVLTAVICCDTDVTAAQSNLGPHDVVAGQSVARYVEDCLPTGACRRTRVELYRFSVLLTPEEMAIATREGLRFLVERDRYQASVLVVPPEYVRGLLSRL